MNLLDLGRPYLNVVLPDIKLAPILASSAEDLPIDPRNRPGFGEYGEAYVTWQMKKGDVSRTLAGRFAFVLGDGF